MEFNDPQFFDQLVIEPPRITEKMKRTWKAISGWALFSSVLGLLGVLVNLIYLLMMTFAMKAFLLSEGFRNGAEFALLKPYLGVIVFLVVVYLGILIYGALIHIFHLLYYTNLRTALKTGSQIHLDSAFRNLKHHFRSFGILMILWLVLTVVLYNIVTNFFARLPNTLDSF